MSGFASALAAPRPLLHAARFEANPATRETPWVKWTILGLGLAFFALFLLMPLAAVFFEAFRKGWATYVAALVEPDALS
ncbi:MAG TPA: sulfate ABC transporter permease subunit CysW, partial [Burkholderiaceae bacterium]|nr:sulfate ABC transporter permease subunit CysW [Burkholderiaceae bacterium]